ncbi:MAG: DNA topoisomerase 3 [Tatlockia sp.]|nr:DNA topoisomerase 3 [Tatlockia sp.]
MKLFLCEKPSQAKDIAAVLGNLKRAEHCFEGCQLVVTWCVGHLLELAPPESYCPNLKPWRMQVLPVIPKTWNLVPQEKTKKQLKAIGQLLKKAKTVVIATDADREGDVIGREILDYFNYQGEVLRLWLSALDEASIKKALNEIRPGHSTEPLYRAGQSRQRADWLMGMNLTMAVSSLYGVAGQGVLSVGRVQTPTLKLIVDRDLTIENFKSCDFFVLKANWQSLRKESFWTTFELPDELKDPEGRCANKSVLEEIAKDIETSSGKVIQFSEAKKSTSAPLCLSLSTLQKIASAQFGFSAKETLETAQALYEKYKATSYPRTDCGYLPESQFADVSEILLSLKAIDNGIAPLIAKCNVNFKSKAWNDKKITAHHGIIPTKNKRVDLAAMSEQERQLYAVIRAHYLAQFLGDYVYLQRQVLVSAGSHQFKGGCNTPLVPGWKEAIVGLDEALEEHSDETSDIPALKDGEPLSLKEACVDSRKSKPAARFTEGTLITAMKSIANYIDDPQLKKILKETAGIGTEATRANILETLVNRSYIKRQGKQLISTAKGRELIQLLPPSISNPATTALWEQVLDAIANGQSEMGDFLDDQCDALEGMLDQLKQQALKTKKGNELEALRK